MNNILQTALRCTEQGYSVIPLRADGSKQPAIAWTPYQVRRATEDEVRYWFNADARLGIVSGKVSGNLLVIDFDVLDFFARFKNVFKTLDAALFEKLAQGAVTKTNKGAHLSCVAKMHPRKLETGSCPAADS